MDVPERKIIAVVTGSRAEFGLLTPVMRAIQAHPALTLRTIVTGVHLSAGTWTDVRDAGFRIDARVRMQQAGRVGRTGDVIALGRGVARLGERFERLRPHVVLVLGDRVEACAAATAASVGGCRLAHIHGGDRAQGVADEAMRHAISKLAHLHFPATAQSRRRLIRMGEFPERVWNVGSPAMDQTEGVEPAANAPDLMVVHHPIGAADARERQWMQATLEATRKRPDCSVQPEEVGGQRRGGWGGRGRLVLSPNHDPGSEGIRAALTCAGVEPVEHLPRGQFLSLLKGAQLIVGNSSAGLIEAAAMKTPCVNIGPRQEGREKPAHVIDCDYGAANIRRAVKKALTLDVHAMRHPYGDGHTGPRIAHILATLDLTAIPLRKRNAY